MAGSMTERNPNVWQFEYSAGTDVSGKRIRFTKTFHGTKREANKALTRFIIECEDGKIARSTPTTVENLSLSYLENYSRRYKKINTQRSDSASIRNWIVPRLGKAKLSKLKKYDIQQWVNDMEDDGLSPKSIRNHFSLLRSMFEYAIDLELLEHNPCLNVRLPKKEHKEARSYSKSEVAAILEGLDQVPSEDSRYKAFILMALFGGFRRGEICGFNWDDLNGNEITIIRTRYGQSKTGTWEDTPKTEKSARTVTLPAFVITSLEQMRIQQKREKLKCGTDYINSPAMFRNEIGEPLLSDRAFEWFRRFCKNINVPPLGLHALRHTHASILASLGADKVQVSNRLGHSQVSTTLNIYTHLFEDADNSLANQLEDYREKIKA